MKSKFIALFFVICASQVLMAQTRLPKASIIGQIMEKHAYTQVPVGDTVYMYNPAYQKFLVGENQYKTQASLSGVNAYRVVIKKYLDQKNQWDGKTYVITDSVEAGNYGFCYRDMFIGNDGIIWVDKSERSANSDCLWEIVPSKTMKGAYNICPAEQNNVFKRSDLPDRWLGCVDSISQDYPLLSLTKGSRENPAIDWTFISVTQGDKVFLAQRKQVLQDLILEVSNAYPQYATAAAQKICDNDESTATQVETAIGDLRLMLLSGGQPKAGETSFTSLLVNPQFSLPNARGWHATFDVKRGSVTWSGGDQTNPCAEAWQSDFDFYQELDGMPKGLYRVDLQAFARTNEDMAAWNELNAAFISTVIYANGAELPVHNLMLHTFANRDDYNFLRPNIDGANAAAWETPEGSFVLHNLRATALAFAEGLFDQSIYCYSDAGSIKAGIKEPVVRTGAWSAWDNLRITYLAETKENYRKAVRYHLEKAKETEALARQFTVQSSSTSEAAEPSAQFTVQSSELKALTQAIKGTDALLKNGTISQLRERLTLLNKEVTQLRQSMQRHLTFDSPAVVDYQNPFTEYDAQEINRANEAAQTYVYKGSLANEDQNPELMAKCLESACKCWYAYPGVFYGQLRSAVDYISHIQYSLGHADEAVNSVMNLIESLESFSTNNAVMKELDKAYAMAGELLSLQKDYDKAEDIFKKGVELSLKLDDKQTAAVRLNQLAYTFVYRNNYDEALQAIDRALELMPDEPNFYDSKGEILLLKGDKKGAKKMWKEVINLDPDFPTKHETVLYRKLFKK